jgi:hypothetical protein
MHFKNDRGEDRWRAVHRPPSRTPDYSIVQFTTEKGARDFIQRWKMSLWRNPEQDWSICWLPEYLTER